MGAVKVAQSPAGNTLPVPRGEGWNQAALLGPNYEPLLTLCRTSQVRAVLGKWESQRLFVAGHHLTP